MKEVVIEMEVLMFSGKTFSIAAGVVTEPERELGGERMQNA